MMARGRAANPASVSHRIRTVFTIGVYGSTREAFFSALTDAGIDIVLDIRRRRAVRGSLYTFANARRLIDELQAREIAYEHVIGLAPDDETRAIQGKADAEAKRRKPERTELDPGYVEQYVARALDRFDFAPLAAKLASFNAPALMCIERIPSACHRSLVAPRLAAALGADDVVHLIPEGAGFNALQIAERRRRKQRALRKRYG
jgi:uncharacterized protein (DUF488 family)